MIRSCVIHGQTNVTCPHSCCASWANYTDLPSFLCALLANHCDLRSFLCDSWACLYALHTNHIDLLFCLGEVIVVPDASIRHCFRQMEASDGTTIWKHLTAHQRWCNLDVSETWAQRIIPPLSSVPWTTYWIKDSSFTYLHGTKGQQTWQIYNVTSEVLPRLTNE